MKRLIAFATATLLLAGPAGAAPVSAVDIVMTATVSSVRGQGVFDVPGGPSRPYDVAEIPNFVWNVGDSIKLRWSLTPAEVALLRGDENTPPFCAGFPNFQFGGLEPGVDGTGGFCDRKIADSVEITGLPAYSDVFEFESTAFGPTINIETGVTNLLYDPETITTSQCCAYVYDPNTNRFVDTGSDASLPGTDGAPYFAQGAFGEKKGSLIYSFALDLLGVGDPNDSNRTPLALGEAMIDFDVHWAVSVPEPAGLGLIGLGALGLASARRRSA